MSVKRHLVVARRAERRASPASRYGLGKRVLAAREPKLLRASTRLAAARLGRPSAPRQDSGAGDTYLVAGTPKSNAEPAGPRTTVTPEALGLGPAGFEWLFGDPDKALSHPDVTAGPAASLPALSPEQRRVQRLSRLTARGGSPYGRGARISEGTADAPVPAAPAASPDRRATRVNDAPPALTTEAVRAELRRASREGSTPAPPREGSTPAPPASPAPAPATPPAFKPAPAPTPPPQAAAPPASASPPAAAPESVAPTDTAAPPRPPRQRLVASRRPVATPPRTLDRASSEPVKSSVPPNERRATVAPPPPPPPPTAPATAPPPTTAIASAARPAQAAVIARTKLLLPPSPGPRSVRLARRPSQSPAAMPPPPPSFTPAPPPPRRETEPPPPSPRRAAVPASRRPVPVRSEMPRHSPAVRPTIQRVPRPTTPAPRSLAPTPAPAPAPAPRGPSLLRRALAALAPRPTPAASPAPARPPAADGVQHDIYVTSAPSAPPPVTVVARPGRSSQPQPWAPAERSSQPLMRAPAGPVAPNLPTSSIAHDPTPSSVPHVGQPATTAATTSPAPTNEHADAAYRDLLTRVREEREQLGQLISHPF